MANISASDAVGHMKNIANGFAGALEKGNLMPMMRTIDRQQYSSFPGCSPAKIYKLYSNDHELTKHSQ